jgi:mono/diheme cytochrome c family protein
VNRQRILIWLLLILLSACTSGATRPTSPTADGERLFAIWCSGCHALDPAGPVALGPTMAGVATRAAANTDGLSPEAWLRRELLEPNVAISPGYNPGLMPSSYAESLRPEQIDALISFMLTLE